MSRGYGAVFGLVRALAVMPSSGLLLTPNSGHCADMRPQVKPWSTFRGIPDSLPRRRERQSPNHNFRRARNRPSLAPRSAGSVAESRSRSTPTVQPSEETAMSYRTVTAVAAVLLIGMWLATDAMAQRGGRGGGGRGGVNVGRPNVNVDINRGVRRPVAVGAAVAAGAAAGSAYYAECGYFPYPPCGYSRAARQPARPPVRAPRWIMPSILA